jgi:hypothetical protein
MRPASKVYYLLSILLLLVLSGCGTGNLGTTAGTVGNGTITAKFVWSDSGKAAKAVASVPTGVVKLRMTVTGSDATGKALPVVRNIIDVSDGSTTGMVSGIYPGSASLVVQALDAKGAITHEGFSLKIPIVANQTTDLRGTPIVMSPPLDKAQDAGCISCHETTLDIRGQNLVADFKQSGHYTNSSWASNSKFGITGVGCAGCHGPTHEDTDPSASGRCWECHGSALEANHQNNGSATTNCTSCHLAHNPKIALPPVPTEVAAIRVSPSRIDLTWTDHGTNETGFKIERRTGNVGTYTQIGTAATNATSYSDTGLEAATTYHYRVRSTNGNDSAPSAEAMVKNSINLQSDSGDFIGQGQSYGYSNANSLITVTATGGHLAVSVVGDQSWSGDFQIPSNLDQLQTGTYDNLHRYPFFKPGLEWSGEGRGSNTLTGSFTHSIIRREGVSTGMETGEGTTPSQAGLQSTI